MTRRTSNGNPYRCQSKASYLALEMIAFVLGESGSLGRWYVIEAQASYSGKLAFKCKSRVCFQVDEAQVYSKSPELQKQLLHSYMDLSLGREDRFSDLRIEKALLPALCAVKDAYPEIIVSPGKGISIQVKKTTRWEIQEAVVDDLYPRLLREAKRLSLVLAEIESTKLS